MTEIKKLFDKKISQWQKAKSLSLSDFMLFISLELRLRASKKNGEHYSYYVELYDKGDKYVLRISDHHFDATTDKYHKAKKTTAVTFSEEKTEDWDYFKPDNSTTATEYVYYESKIGKDELISIARDIVTYLETGNYPSTIPPDEIHHSPLLDGVFDERETMRFALHQLVKELGEKEGKETFEWYCKTYNVTISDPMPETVKYEIFGTDKPFLELDDLNAKLLALRKFFRDRDKDKRYNYKVRICSAENDGKDPIHAYKYPTGTAYADIRFEIHSEGSSGWDYLRIAFKFDNTNEVRIDCDALPEYKELIAQLQQSDNNSTYAFAKEIAALYEQGERLDWVKAKKLAAPHRIESEQAIMQACELAVVLSARKIAQNGQSIAQRYAALKDLYEQQVTIRPLDTQSKLLQQYSTPCPLAFLLGEYVKGATDLKEHQQYYLEPSAGNGMLTIALPTDKVFANDLDEIRYQNLLVQGFHKVENGDALRMIANPNFRGIITNPPFAKLAPKDKIERHGWEINTLDYKMAVLALDNMANHGRAAIIVGGKMWNSYWKQQSETSKKRVLFGQWKTFLGYLYATYNVEDVIYINGDNIYRKQGTTYPIVVILINRRWNEYSEEHKPNYVFDPERDTIIDTFDQLFERMMKHLQSAPSSLDDINVEEIRRKLEDGTAASMVDQIYQKANAAAEEEEKRERDIAARKRKFAFKLKLQLQLKEQDKELVRKTHAEVSRMVDEYFEKHPIDIDKTAEKRGYLRDNIAYCQEKIEKEREKGKRASQSKIDAYEERIAECQQMLQTHAMQKPQVQVGAWYVNNKHHDMVTYIYDNWGGKYQTRSYKNGEYKYSNEFRDPDIFLQTHTKIDTPKWASQEIQSKERDLQRGDVFTLPKTWLKKSYLFAEEKDLLDFYSIAQVTNDGSVVVINEQTMLPQTYSIKEFEEKGFKFHHHQDNYGQIKK
ncbi:MAG: hypothetical protein IKR17_02740 [Bacteroidales bacterium]|nr:hypothetical protein [Bacteroidales bacterium]